MMKNLKPAQTMRKPDFVLINKCPRLGDFVMDVNGRIYKVFDCISPLRFAGYCYSDSKEYDLNFYLTKVLAKSEPNQIVYPSLFDIIAIPEDPWLFDVVHWVIDVDYDFNYAISNGRDKRFCIDSQSIVSLSIQITTDLTDADILSII